jgi:hypothetical protein
MVLQPSVNPASWQGGVCVREPPWQNSADLWLICLLFPDSRVRTRRAPSRRLDGSGVGERGRKRMSEACEVNASSGGRTRLPTPQDRRRPVVRAVRHERFPQNTCSLWAGPRRWYCLSAKARARSPSSLLQSLRLRRLVMPMTMAVRKLVAPWARCAKDGQPVAGQRICRLLQPLASRPAPSTRVLPPLAVRLAISWRWQSNGRFPGSVPYLNRTNGSVW